MIPQIKIIPQGKKNVFPRFSIHYCLDLIYFVVLIISIINIISKNKNTILIHIQNKSYMYQIQTI